MSQDPVFLEIGQTNDGISILKNPQAQNSYSYALNNPILLKDSEGRIAVGFGVTLGGNAPGIFGQQSFHIAFAGTNWHDLEAGIISTSGGGGITAVSSVNVGLDGLYSSNANSIKDLGGVDVGVGGSWGSGIAVGGDITTSKVNSQNERMTTISGNIGFGLVGSPYVVPAEFHGGAYYTKPIVSGNISNGINNVKSITNASYSAVRTQLSSIYSRLQSLSDKVKSKEKDSKK